MRLVKIASSIQRPDRPGIVSAETKTYRSSLFTDLGATRSVTLNARIMSRRTAYVKHHIQRIKYCPSSRAIYSSIFQPPFRKRRSGKGRGHESRQPP